MKALNFINRYYKFTKHSTIYRSIALKRLFVSIILFTCSVVQAHSGHDHQHWLSNPIHLLTLFSIVCMIAIAYKLTRNNVLDMREKK
jgi:4-hydroxybenzoate polyprenyltransferase